MAETTKKKSSANKNTARSNTTASARKTAAEKPAEKKKSGSNTAIPVNDDNQFWSVILFALGILAALMTFIKGTAGWRGIHNFMLGMFGAAVFFVPVILIYTAVLIGMEKSQKCVAGRAGWGVAMAFLASAALQIFIVGEMPGHSFATLISELYKQGRELKGGGVAALIIAGPLIKAFGELGSRIITVILFFVFGLLLSGKGLIEFLKVLARPFIFIGNCFQGLHSVFVGGEFSDAFEDDDDDIDDEQDKRNFEADIEALELIESNKKHKKIEIITDPEPPADHTPTDFLMDIPLPDEAIHDSAAVLAEEVIPDAPVKPAKSERHTKKNSGSAPDEDLEQLISKANDRKESLRNEEVLSPLEDAPEEEQIQYIMPPIDLLSAPEIRSNSAEAAAEMREKADVIVNTLRSFGVEVKIKDIFRGPAITRYEIQPGVGVKISKIKSLEDDIALSLAAQGVRIEAPVPGKAAVGIEIPNSYKDMVTLREILGSPEFRNSKSKLSFALGKDITGNNIVGDIAKMPHVIIAGTTGSGKSVCTRSIIMSILYNCTPDEVKLILIDPKIVEFKIFEGIPQLLIPIVTDSKKAAGALNWAVQEMMRRYKTFADAGANDLKSYNQLAEASEDMKFMPQIVVFIDELADMMLVAGKEVEDSICRLAQMGRAAGMHLVVATQRPTTDVITGLIKANIPSRIALSVKSQIDSRTIIDMAGADKLLGNGDMLYMPIGSTKPVRVQGCFASNKDINTTLDFIKEQVSSEYDQSIIEAVDSYTPAEKGSGDDSSSDSGMATGSDEDYVERAIEVAVMNGQLSTSMLQRKLKLGYARAARIMDELEEMGVIGESEGAKPRRVLMSKMQYDERRLRMQNRE